MEDNAGPSFARTSNAEDRRGAAIELVDELIGLYERTDPQGGKETADGKDLRALNALSAAAELVHQLAEWAIQHQVGLAAELTKPAGSGLNPHPEHEKAVEAADDHRHELVGKRLQNEREIPVAVQRQALLNVLFANVAGLPLWINIGLRDAIAALRFGDALPLVVPDKNDRKVSFEETRLQLAALGFVEYRRVQGLTMTEATARVASVYGVSPETLRSWGARLNADWGPIEVFRARSVAISAGRYSRQPNLPSSGRQWWDNKYGEAALRASAAQFSSINRDRKAKSSRKD